jgi:hypothetical protein
MADEHRMPYKQYAKFEKLFFLYGSTVKMLEPVRLTEWQTVSEQIWAWAKEKVSSVVEEYTDGFLEPPPEAGAPGAESPDETALHAAHTSQQKCITVTAIPAHCLVASAHDLTRTFCGRCTPPVGSYGGCIRGSMVMIAVAKHRSSCSG